MAGYENENYNNNDRLIDLRIDLDSKLKRYLQTKNDSNEENSPLRELLREINSLSINDKRIYQNYIGRIIKWLDNSFIKDTSDDLLQLNKLDLLNVWRGIENNIPYDHNWWNRNNYEDNYYNNYNQWKKYNKEFEEEEYYDDNDNYYNNNDYERRENNKIWNNLILSWAWIKGKKMNFKLKVKDSYTPVKDTQIIQEWLFWWKIIIYWNEVIDYVQSGDIMTFYNQWRKESINIKSIPSNQSIKIEINNIFLYIEWRNRAAWNHYRRNH